MSGPPRPTLRPPTLKDVARTAQVSVATVSHVLNPDSVKFVSPPVRARVQAAAAELGYRPNLLARGMRGKGRRALAILIPQFENFFFTQLVTGAERAAYLHGYVLLICSTYDDPAREHSYIESLLSQQVDGFLLSPTLSGAINTEVLRDRGVPYAVVDRPLKGFRGDYDYAGFSNREGAVLGARHLLERGHRRIAYLGWRTRLPIMTDRYAGFREELARWGLAAKEMPAFFRPHTPAEGERLAEELFVKGGLDGATAIFAAHQYLAEGLIVGMRRLGKQVPADVSLVVYGRPSWTWLTNPPLTCVQMPDAEIGELGAKMLIDRIEGRRNACEQIWLAASLAAGASVADGPNKEMTA
jgi:LacI family transcriptional regulator